jgi:hypothetical protein
MGFVFYHSELRLGSEVVVSIGHVFVPSSLRHLYHAKLFAHIVVGLWPVAPRFRLSVDFIVSFWLCTVKLFFLTDCSEFGELIPHCPFDVGVQASAYH